MPSSPRLLTAAALLILTATVAPARASEVVKLARMVITGKWLGTMPSAAPPKTEKLPPVVLEAHALKPNEQVAREGRGLVLPI